MKRSDWLQQVVIDCPRCEQQMRYVPSTYGRPKSFRCDCGYCVRLESSQEGTLAPSWRGLHVRKEAPKVVPTLDEVHERADFIRRFDDERRRLALRGLVYDKRVGALEHIGQVPHKTPPGRRRYRVPEGRDYS